MPMDNASYHSVIKEGTKAPTSATRKGDMQKWPKDKKIPFDGKMKKTELYEIIKLKKPEPNNFWNFLYNVVRFPILWFYFVFNMITKVSTLFWGYGFKSFYY
jgi:hypothetical protein